MVKQVGLMLFPAPDALFEIHIRHNRFMAAAIVHKDKDLSLQYQNKQKN